MIKNPFSILIFLLQILCVLSTFRFLFSKVVILPKTSNRYLLIILIIFVIVSINLLFIDYCVTFS